MGHGTILSTDHQQFNKEKSTRPDGLHLAQLEGAIQQAARALLGLQHPDGYWCFELEADCTIPAEYILMMHYLGDVDEQLERKLALPTRQPRGGRRLASLLPWSRRDQLLR